MYQYYNKTATTNKFSPVDGFGAPDSWPAMDWATETPASLLGLQLNAITVTKTCRRAGNLLTLLHQTGLECHIAVAR